MKNIAIVTARSGSKGITDKNIKNLAGKPLMGWSIEAALKSGMFETVMVSTDSERYAAIAREFGAEVPFLRSAAASTDTASSWDTVEEVLLNYRKTGRVYDNFMLLQPTSPLRTEHNIVDAFEEMKKNDADSVISVCELEYSPFLCNNLPENHAMNGFLETRTYIRRQDVKAYYRINGAIYLAKVNFFLANHYLYRDRCYAYIMDARESIDIDEEIDFEIAEFLLRRNKQV